MTESPKFPTAMDEWRRRVSAATAKSEVRALLASGIARVTSGATDEARLELICLALAITERGEVLAGLPMDARDQLAQTVPFVLATLQSDPRGRWAKQEWFLIKARAHRQAGEWLPALQAAEIAVGAAAEPSAECLLALAFALNRLGRPSDALPHLSVLAESRPTEAEARAGEVTRDRLHRRLGLPKLLEDEWEETLTTAAREKNPIPLLRKLGRGSPLRRHDRLILASLLVLATEDREAFAGLPAQRGLRELLPDATDADADGWRRASEATFALKAMLELDAATDDALKIAELAEAARRLPDLEIEAALLAGVRRLAMAAALPGLERVVLERYQEASRALTGGRSDDHFQVLAARANEASAAAAKPLPKSYFSLGAQVKRMAMVTSSLLGTTVNGWLRQALASPEQAVVIKDRQLAEYAATLRDFFADAKGIMQKATQITEFVEYAFPKQVSAELYVARRQLSSPMEPRLSRQIVEEDLGRPLAEVFSAWEDLPIAAASIGQVHRAKLLDGTEVAVKVKFPRMENLVRSQLRYIGVVAPFLEYLYPSVQIKRTIKAASSILLRECDFVNEVKNQQRFAEAVAGLPGISVPKVFPSLCTARIITMELARGTRFYDFLAVASAAERDRAGALIFEALYHAAFVHGIMHSDPHPGNFLFSQDGITILDFGSCTTNTQAYNQHVLEAIDALERKDKEALLRSARAHGFLTGERSFESDSALIRQYEHNFHPFLSREPFKFTRDFLADNFRDVNRNAVRLQLPADMVEPLRFAMGYASTLSALGATADWARIFAEIRARRPQPGLLASA